LRTRLFGLTSAVSVLIQRSIFMKRTPLPDCRPMRFEDSSDLEYPCKFCTTVDYFIILPSCLYSLCSLSSSLSVRRRSPVSCDILVPITHNPYTTSTTSSRGRRTVRCETLCFCFKLLTFFASRRCLQGDCQSIFLQHEGNKKVIPLFEG